MFGRCIISAEQRHIGPFEERNQNHAGNKAADMRKIGDAAVTAGQGSGNREKLPANPEAENKPRRQIDETNKDDDQNKRADRRARVEHKIGAENPCNAA